ncbi:poly-beta-1,6 N-acetyl-D-glucosamine export porin PgaA, partial [Klebsiella pneumoniae]|nr:poly-beta-1,6 N-acetyl-D-glucosamine export porin PgaA [Klebsiella pneumoniae]
RLYGSPTPQPNDDWLTAQSLNVHYLAATNDLPQAEARMQRLARAREIHYLSELRLSVGKGLHSDNPVSGTHDLSFETAIY